MGEMTGNVLFLSLILFCSWISCHAVKKVSPFSFSFDEFGKNSSLDSEIIFRGDAEINGSVVRLTRPISFSSGLIVYREPVRFWGTKPGFSAYFSFSVASRNGASLSFFLLPASVQLESRAIMSRAISIEFVTMTVNGSENLFQISVGRHFSLKRYNLSVPKDGNRLHSWIDYDGALKRIDVRLSKRKDSRLINSSRSIDLSNVLQSEAMFVGLSSSNNNYNQTCTVYSWSFRVNQGAPYHMHSEPLDPNAYMVHSHGDSPVHLKRSNYSIRMLIAMLFAAACGALFTFFVMFLWNKIVARLPVAPIECSVHPVDSVDDKVVLVVGKDVDSAKK